MIRSSLLALAILAGAAPALAQTAVQFVPRYDFHLGADHLSSEDPRFVWDTNFGGAIDFVDYGVGRTTFAANYEAVLGEEFRNFDPNQGSYLLDLSTSLRTGGFEVAALFHHTSRHLSDRPKRDPVDWNMFGAGIGRDLRRGNVEVRTHGEVLGVLLRSNVDYSWQAGGNVGVRVPLRPHISGIGGGQVTLVGVDGSRNRGTQVGARGEAGIRFEGVAGAIELIVAGERRLDAAPLDFSTRSWVSAGFRFVTR